MGAPLLSDPAHPGALNAPAGRDMVRRVTGGKALPAEVVQQMVAKTDGVPLFVEELTKMVLESGCSRSTRSATTDRAAAPAGHSATLQDSLMARLDRLADGEGRGATRGDPRARRLPMSCCRPWRRWTRRPCSVDWSSWSRRRCSTSGAAAAGHLHVQACPDPGCGLSVAAEEHAAAVPPADCPGGGRPSSPRPSRRSPSCSPSTTPRRAQRRRPCPTGSGRANGPLNARPMWKPSATCHRD